MQPNKIWNSVLPTKVYVILSQNGIVLTEAQGDYAHVALREAKTLVGPAAVVAIEKKQYERSVKT